METYVILILAWHWKYQVWNVKII